MDKLIDFLSAFNAQTIFAMAVILWYFTREIRNEIRSEIAEIRSEISEQSKRSDRLYEMFIDLLKEKR